MKIFAKHEPYWFELRKWIARILVNLARKVEPNSEDALAYLAEQYMRAVEDSIIYGRGGIKVEYVPLAELPPEEEPNASSIFINT